MSVGVAQKSRVANDGQVAVPACWADSPAIELSDFNDTLFV